MSKRYDRCFKYMIVHLIKDEKNGTANTARNFKIPLKTVEKWITVYNKDNKAYIDGFKDNEEIVKLLEKQVSKMKIDELSFERATSVLNKMKKLLN